MSVSAESLQTLWEQASGAVVELDANGRIVDFLDPTRSRPDTREERVRQGYARVLVEKYRYPKSCLAFEVPIRIGSKSVEADIVVFTSPEARTSRNQNRVLLIVETKAPNKTESKNQLASYIFASSAAGGVWTNGETVAYFRRIDSPTQQLQEWTNIPRRGETWDTVGNYPKVHLRPPRDLKQVFRRCHNAIYGGGLDTEDAALDMVRIILAKYRDEQNSGDVCQFRCTPEEYSTSSGRRLVGNRARRLFNQVVNDHPDVFSRDEQITIGDDGLATVVNELQPFRFLADDDIEQVHDVIGTAFEIYVASHLKGTRGQFFTNRLVVNMMVELFDPDEQDIILDPACGSGGFLIACLRYIRAKIRAPRRSTTAKRLEMQNITKHLVGIDISLKLIRVAKTNMILNGDGHSGLVQGNALAGLDNLSSTFPLSMGANTQRPTMILTNPPFGASHELRARRREILEQFQLGHAWVSGDDGWLRQRSDLLDGEGVPPEILFIERCVDLLAPGGKLAIVIARGVLDNPDALATRQYILRRTRLLGAINCHPNTFAPYNGTKAFIIIAEKKVAPGIQRDEDYPVFMAISQRIGQDSQGREIYKKDDKGAWVITDGQRMLDHDMTELAAAWRDFQMGRLISYEAAWTIPLSRILQAPNMRFNPVRYAPQAEQALARVLELADTPDWTIERLGDLATHIFNGPRFKRPFAPRGHIGTKYITNVYSQSLL